MVFILFKRLTIHTKFILILPFLKVLTTILLLIIFLFVSILMPYANFDDNGAAREVYDEQQQEDPDLSMGEFIFEKLLYVGKIFDPGDDDDAPHNLPLKNQQPLQPMQIQAGFLDCTKTIIKVQDSKTLIEKPTCLFKENMFSFDFHASVFHPPAFPI